MAAAKRTHLVLNEPQSNFHVWYMFVGYLKLKKSCTVTCAQASTVGRCRHCSQQSMEWMMCMESRNHESVHVLEPNVERKAACIDKVTWLFQFNKIIWSVLALGVVRLRQCEFQSCSLAQHHQQITIYTYMHTYNPLTVPVIPGSIAITVVRPQEFQACLPLESQAVCCSVLPPSQALQWLAVKCTVHEFQWCKWQGLNHRFFRSKLRCHSKS